MDNALAHARTIARAQAANDELGAHFDALGGAELPGVGIYGAYQAALDALQGQLDSLALLRRTLDRLQVDATREFADALDAAIASGSAWALADLGAWDVVPAALTVAVVARETRTPALDAFGAMIEGQIRAALAMYALGIGLDAILPQLTPAVITRDAARLVGLAANNTAEMTVAQSLDKAGAGNQFGLQAIATIDERTTDCCLRVAGQVVPLDGEFILTGTPRYFDRMKQPPFHYWCRSVTALVKLESANDDLTRIMRAAADVELAARAAKDTTPFAGPINAGSVRPSQRQKLRRVVMGG
jgi:hypothetical protein